MQLQIDMHTGKRMCTGYACGAIAHCMHTGYMYIHVKFICRCFPLGNLLCAVSLCLVVCLTLLASFFLPSHLSSLCMYVGGYVGGSTCIYISCIFMCEIKSNSLGSTYYPIHLGIVL